VKKYIYGAVIALLIVVSGAIVFTHTHKSSTTSVSSNIVSQSSDGLVIDVRTPQEYATSHAAGSLNIPLADIQAGNFKKLDRQKTVYLYCRSGNRAGLAKNILEKAGFKRVVNIGGLDDWQSQGGKICSSGDTAC